MSKRIKLNISRLFSVRVSRFALTSSERHETGEGSTIWVSTSQDKCLVEQFHRPSFFPKNVYTFFAAIYDVRMLFCNRLHMDYTLRNDSPGQSSHRSAFRRVLYKPLRRGASYTFSCLPTNA